MPIILWSWSQSLGACKGYLPGRRVVGLVIIPVVFSAKLVTPVEHRDINSSLYFCTVSLWSGIGGICLVEECCISHDMAVLGVCDG